MSQDEIIEQLQAENARLREEKAQELAEKLRLLELVEELSRRLQEKTEEKEDLGAEKQRLQEQMEQLSQRLHELEGRVSKDSSTSHKPPVPRRVCKKDEESAAKERQETRRTRRPCRLYTQFSSNSW